MPCGVQTWKMPNSPYLRTILNVIGLFIESAQDYINSDHSLKGLLEDFGLGPFLNVFGLTGSSDVRVFDIAKYLKT